jgi:hypothetical protein
MQKKILHDANVLSFINMFAYVLCSVHAYIVFKDEQSARAALSHNMAQVRLAVIEPVKT